jgi:transposase InsO family protein
MLTVFHRTTKDAAARILQGGFRDITSRYLTDREWSGVWVSDRPLDNSEDRRNLVWINVTTNPTAEWIARQLTEAFPWNAAPRHLVRDRDQIYGTIVTRRLRAMGIRDKPVAPASPWQKGFAERLIGSIRRECVDHFIVLGEAHLRHILRTYAHYYNHIRTHWSLDKDTPVSRPVQRIGSINSHAILGGLHHHYVRL